MKTISVTEARKCLHSLLDEVADLMSRYILPEKGVMVFWFGSFANIVGSLMIHNFTR